MNKLIELTIAIAWLAFIAGFAIFAIASLTAIEPSFNKVMSISILIMGISMIFLLGATLLQQWRLKRRAERECARLFHMCNMERMRARMTGIIDAMVLDDCQDDVIKDIYDFIDKQKKDAKSNESKETSNEN